jgi:chemotaxis protein CheZ
MTDELEALFDRISDEQGKQADAGEPAPASPSEASEEELEALFDELSAETRTVSNATTGAAPELTKEAEPSEDELEALFDELSKENRTADSDAAVPDETVMETESTEDELEALFDELSMSPTGGPTAPSVAADVGMTAESPPSDFPTHPDPADTAGLPLYDRIGGILRQLHDSMRELGYDRALQDVATEVIDAKGRLEYVATLTEQAATRVLNSIDIGMPQQEELSKTAHDLEERWTALFDGNMDVDAFKQLAQDSRDFAVNTASRADEEKARLMEIMMAQDFQDITGQVIKKVVVITKKLERELAQLLRDNAPPESKEKVVDLMAGPDIPDRAMDQDDVDGLLANLGF